MTKKSNLKPFWHYYGGKYRMAPRYPKPVHDTIVEPFAGAAGYSMRYPDRKIILVEKYSVVAEMWKYLISVPASEIMAIPVGVSHVDELPSWVPEPARHLVGWWFNHASASPRKQLSAGRKRLALTGRKTQGWTETVQRRVACQLDQIRHWRVIVGDHTQAPDIEATWFIDPPYNNKAGSYYVEKNIDYPVLGEWCKTRNGQVLVCENEGASWLPFEPFATFQRGHSGKNSREVLWQN